MDHKTYIETKIKDALSGIEDAQIILADDFTEERIDNMVVVGIADETQLNANLPDYKYQLEIIVDTFIDEDTDGALFKKTWQYVDETLSQWHLMREQPLETLFGTSEIVFFRKDSIDFMLDQQSKSNRAVFRFTVIGSFDSDEDNE